MTDKVRPPLVALEAFHQVLVAPLVQEARVYPRLWYHFLRCSSNFHPSGGQTVRPIHREAAAFRLHRSVLAALLGWTLAVDVVVDRRWLDLLESAIVPEAAAVVVVVVEAVAAADVVDTGCNPNTNRSLQGCCQRSRDSMMWLLPPGESQRNEIWPFSFNTLLLSI